jgi:transmembrane sensor
MKKNFTQFSVLDFAEEDSFIRWVRHGDPQAAVFWERWLTAHPEKSKEVTEAARLIRLLRVQQEEEPTRESIEALWAQIDIASRRDGVLSKAQPSQKTILRRLLPYAAAAALALLLFFQFNRPSKQIVVRNGDQIALTLPDGSLLKANAGTTISYQPGRWKKERHVRLNGEAFFEVKKGRPFIVSTDQGNVEVLGTRFNVHARAGGFKVDCLSGKIRVTGRSRDTQVLTAGLSTDNSENGRLSAPAPLDVALIGAWREGRFFFREATLKEVFAEIERQFDVSIRTTPQVLARRTTTFFERGNLDSALYKVCWPMQLEARREGKMITIN